MESVYFINLIFIFVLNVFLFFSGVCLNSVVIISIWRSVQLRKKICYFMIMVLSCCDLLAVLTNNPLTALTSMSWLTERWDLSLKWLRISGRFASAFFMFSLLALFVMSFDRYLAASYPFFHRTSVTKKKLLTLLTILIIIELTLTVFSANDAIISYQTHMLILSILLTPPMLFINYKLFLVVQKNRGNNRISHKKKKMFSVSRISSCLLVVVCYVVELFTGLVYIGMKVNSRDTIMTLGGAYLAGIWGKTVASIYCTSNCLIFFWKNKVLRKEGWKVLKSIKIRLGVQS